MQLTTTLPNTAALPQHKPLKRLGTLLQVIKQRIIRAMIVDNYDLQVKELKNGSTHV